MIEFIYYHLKINKIMTWRGNAYHERGEEQLS